ncbi:MAG: DUF3592 domain-containing protein [Acidobacteriota bacterium]
MRIRMGSANTVGSKIGTSIFALIFAGFGIFFGGMMLRTMLPAFATWFWPPTDCTIEDSRFVDSSAAAGKESPFNFEVHYTYNAQGRAYKGETYKIGYSGGSDAAEPQQLVAAYPPGSTARCYVDPKNPTNVVLRRANLWVLLVLLFPAVFVGFAVLMLFMTWSSGSPSSAPGNSLIPLGKPAMSPGKTMGCGIAAFSIFAIFGLAFLIPIFAVPAWRVLQARSWHEAECSIRSSAVGGHSSDKGAATYSVDLVYSYEVDGHTYTGNRYQFMTGSSSGRSAKEAAVAALQPGTVTRCYVDPADPTSAVIDRGFAPMMWFGLIPLLFVVIGVGGMVAVVVATRRGSRQQGVEQWLPGMKAATSGTAAAIADLGLGMRGALPELSEARVLEPSQGPFAKLGCTVLIALFVNGLVGTFFWKGVLEPMQTGGSTDGCVTLILIPFGLLALMLLLSVPYQLLACFNPRPRLELLPGVLQPGKAARLRWHFTGSTGRLTRVAVSIEGTESATHRVGTSSTTSNSVFWRQTILEATRPEEIINGGEIAISVPDSLVPSFDSSNNKVVYKMKVTGAIARWPDVNEEFEIQMAPEGARR